MAPSCSCSSSSCSSSLLLLLLMPLLSVLLLPLPRQCGAAPDASCRASFRSGQDGFVLDAADAVNAGASLLDTVRVHTAEECEHACCADSRCNLGLLEPRGPAPEGTRACALFSCLHRNRFVCRFVNQAGYRSYVREHVFQKHLEGPQGSGEQAPPIANAGRDVIVQPGATVTLNGIESLALGGAITAYRWSQAGGAALTLQEAELPDQVRLVDLPPGAFVFRLSVTDSNGQSDEATVRVLVLSPELSSSFCLAPLKVGPCRAAFPRWRYNASTGSCERFEFGGCKPNNNNYLTQDECVSACRGVAASSERSVVLPASEVCGSACRPDQLICGSGCCLDRNLECDGVKHCSDGSDEERCNKLNQTFSRLLSIDVNQNKARCAEPPRTGPCRASHTRWYYDPLNRKCHRFTFGGCDGNDNNFEEEERCGAACDGVTERNVFSRGMFERFEKEVGDDEGSGSVALAVVLAVVILALLAVVAYCALRARRERAAATASPARLALSEGETLVYNSTTKPA